MDNGTGGSEAKSDSGTPNGEGEEENEKEDERREKEVTFTESRRTMDISPDDKGQNGEVTSDVRGINVTTLKVKEKEEESKYASVVVVLPKIQPPPFVDQTVGYQEIDDKKIKVSW